MISLKRKKNHTRWRCGRKEKTTNHSFCISKFIDHENIIEEEEEEEEDKQAN